MLSMAYGGEAMKKSSVFEWHKQFKEGHKNMGDVEITNDNTLHLLQYQRYYSL
jgi:translation elongation factor EF-4